MRILLSLLSILFLSLSWSVTLADDDRGRDRDRDDDYYAHDYDDDDDRHGRRYKGLNRKAKRELHAAGVDKYLGEFVPAVSMPVGDGWIKHTFDPDPDMTIEQKNKHLSAKLALTPNSKRKIVRIKRIEIGAQGWQIHYRTGSA